MNLRNTLVTGVVGLAAIILADKANINNSDSVKTQPAVLTQEQIQHARPIAFLSNDYPVMNHSQSRKEEKSKPAIPPAPEVAPEVRLQDPSEFIKDSSPLEPATPKTPAPEPKPDLRHIKPESQQPKPRYDYPAPAPQLETVKRFNDEMNLYESMQIHRFVSKLSLPQFPLATACIEKRKKPFSSLTELTNLPSLFPFSQKNGVIADVQYTEFQPELGMNLIDTRTELETLAKGIATNYQPANLDSKAFEKLADYAGLDNNFIKEFERTRNATVYDALAQFSAQYADSLRRHGNYQFSGLVVYQTSEGHLHVTGNAQEIKQIKHKTRK